MTEVNIETPRKNYPVFSNLVQGDWFKYAHDIFIKIDNSAVSLHGFMLHFPDDLHVKPIDKVNIELTYKEQS